MIKLDEELKNAKSVGITGHVRPDGDCVGSTLGLYNYIKDNYPQIKVNIFLEPPESVFSFIRGFNEIVTQEIGDIKYDLFVILDVGDIERVAEFVWPYIANATKTICIDHHVTSKGIGDVNYNQPQISSASEVLISFLDMDKISKFAAESLYTGIINDTGVFKYQSVNRKTMEIAGELMSKGIDFTSIIDDTFFRKSYAQNKAMGWALMEARLELDGKLIYSYMPKSILNKFGLAGRETGGIIDQLRFTNGIEVAMFIYDLPGEGKKVSFRSVKDVDVNVVANAFGGGGHMRAAGCTVSMPVDELIEKTKELLRKQL